MSGQNNSTNIGIAFLAFVVGIVIGFGSSEWINMKLKPEPEPEPDSCSAPFALNFINKTLLETYMNRSPSGQRNWEVSRAITSSQVRTLSLSRFGNTCSGSLELSYEERRSKTDDELPKLTRSQTDFSIWLDEEGNEFTDWWIWEPRDEEVDVSYELYLTDNGQNWVRLLSYD